MLKALYAFIMDNSPEEAPTRYGSVVLIRLRYKYRRHCEPMSLFVFHEFHKSPKGGEGTITLENSKSEKNEKYCALTHLCFIDISNG